MRRPAPTILLIGLLATSAGSTCYSVVKGLEDGADLERRAEEVAMFRRGDDPYRDEEDMTYPPSALPVFAASVPTSSVRGRRLLWVVLNFAAMIGLCAVVIARWGGPWPPWSRAAFCLVVASSKPARAGIALGQFHLIPTALIVAAEVLAKRAVVAGVLVGVALIKPTMAAPYLIVLAVRSRWKTLLVAAAVQATLFGAVSAQLKTGPIRLTQEWLRNARAQYLQGTIDAPTLAGRLFPSSRLDPTLVSLAVLIATGSLLFLLRKKTGLGLLCVALYSAAIATYHRHYDLVLLLPTLAYLIDGASRGRDRWAAPIAAMFGLVLVVPSSSRLMGRFEPLYDAGFVVVAYLVFFLLVGMLVREPENAAV